MCTSHVFRPDSNSASNQSTVTFASGVDIKSSAIRWISTYQGVVEAATAMVPLVQWPSKLQVDTSNITLT